MSDFSYLFPQTVFRILSFSIVGKEYEVRIYLFQEADIFFHIIQQ